MAKTPKQDYHVRWLIRRDMPIVLAIERTCFQEPWAEEDFVTALRQRNTIGMVAVDDHERVVGYVLYNLHRHGLEIINLAVSPDCWRRGVGTALVHKLVSKLSPKRRRVIWCAVRETNMAALVFFKRLDFYANNVMRNYYVPLSDESAIEMKYRYYVASGKVVRRNIDWESING